MISGVPRGAEGAIRPGRHFEGGNKKGKKKNERKEKKEKREERKRKKERKRKYGRSMYVITVKLKWNIWAAAPYARIT